MYDKSIIVFKSLRYQILLKQTSNFPPLEPVQANNTKPCVACSRSSQSPDVLEKKSDKLPLHAQRHMEIFTLFPKVRSTLEFCSVCVP